MLNCVKKHAGNQQKLSLCLASLVSVLVCRDILCLKTIQITPKYKLIFQHRFYHFCGKISDTMNLLRISLLSLSWEQSGQWATLYRLERFSIKKFINPSSSIRFVTYYICVLKTNRKAQIRQIYKVSTKYILRTHRRFLKICSVRTFGTAYIHT